MGEGKEASPNSVCNCLVIVFTYLSLMEEYFLSYVCGFCLVSY